MIYNLPTSAEFNHRQYPIRTDFRVMLEIIEALNDPDLNGRARAEAAITMFYPDCDALPDYPAAVRFFLWFLSGGHPEPGNRSPRLVDWERDFRFLIAPVNRVLGFDARGVPYDPVENTGGLHWWTFLAAYMEIGRDCTMSAVLTIRDKRARGAKLEKAEREWYRRHRELVDLPAQYTPQDEELFRRLARGEMGG